MNREEFENLLIGQVVRLVDRKAGLYCEDTLDEDYLAATGSDNLRVVFQSGLELIVRSRLLNHDDGVEIRVLKKG